MSIKTSQPTKIDNASELPVFLKDLTLWHWIYFQRWHGHDPSRFEAQNRENFISVLNDAFRWVGKSAESKAVHWDDLPQNRQISVRLDGTGWIESIESDGLQRSLEARAMLD